MNTQLQAEFSEWLSQYLALELREQIKAFNFNLYEGEDDYHVQLIGSETLPEEDDDWACDEVFTTGEDVFLVSRKQAGSEWEEGLEFITKLVKWYLEHGNYANVLKRVKVVGIGFVDGNIDIIYKG